MDQIAAELIDILTSDHRRAPDEPSGQLRSTTERLLQPELVVRGSSAPG
jgi:hypothetical protein